MKGDKIDEKSEDNDNFVLTEEFFLLPKPDGDYYRNGKKINLSSYEVMDNYNNPNLRIKVCLDKIEVFKDSVSEIIDINDEFRSDLPDGKMISNLIAKEIDEIDREKNYFIAEISTKNQKMKHDFVDMAIIGREPVDTDFHSIHSIHLNSGNSEKDQFMNVGSSRNHALLIRDGKELRVYNISTNFSVFIIDMNEETKSNQKLDPIDENKQDEILNALAADKNLGLDNIKKVLDDVNVPFMILKENNLLAVGNKVFGYKLSIDPLEKPLEGSGSIIKKENRTEDKEDGKVNGGEDKETIRRE